MKSFIKRTLITAVYCAGCNERYNDNSEYHEVFVTQAEAIQAITADYWTVKGNKAYCEKCSKQNIK